MNAKPAKVTLTDAERNELETWEREGIYACRHTHHCPTPIMCREKFGLFAAVESIIAARFAAARSALPKLTAQVREAEKALADKSAEFVRMENAWRRECDKLRGVETHPSPSVLISKDMLSALEHQLAQAQAERHSIEAFCDEAERLLGLWKNDRQNDYEPGHDKGMSVAIERLRLLVPPNERRQG